MWMPGPRGNPTGFRSDCQKPTLHGALCGRSVLSLWKRLTSAKHAIRFGPAQRAWFCSQVLPSQAHPKARDRQIHSGVHHRRLAEKMGVTRPEGRMLGRLGLRLIQTVNEENGSGSHFRAVELLPFLFELRLVYPV